MAREQAGELPMTPFSIELSSVDRCSVDRNASFMSAHSSPSFSQEPDVEGLRRSMGRGVCREYTAAGLCFAWPGLLFGSIFLLCGALAPKHLGQHRAPWRLAIMRARKCQVIIRQRLPKCLHIPRHMHVYHGFPAFAQLFPKRARTCHSAVVHTLMDLGLVHIGMSLWCCAMVLWFADQVGKLVGFRFAAHHYKEQQREREEKEAELMSTRVQRRMEIAKNCSIVSAAIFIVLVFVLWIWGIICMDSPLKCGWARVAFWCLFAISIASLTLGGFILFRYHDRIEIS
ncbi:unnamed protein product [Durusdinium trenchii]|uniref:Uncharacterized protein n=1 Tax=Durusdinium trenchii TaxID=1381693 RepID=A0ABP0PF62_9DINO